MDPDYKVKLEVFEGPLDLLLYLIKQDEIDIYDISIERITRQYLEYLQTFNRWDLIRQLIEYKKFKEAAADLHLREVKQESIFAREACLLSENPLRLEEVGIFQLINAFQSVIKRIEARQDVQEIFGERFSVSEKIDAILRRVAAGVPIRFSDLFGAIVSRVEIAVTFLALLELIRLKQVRATQKNIFAEIEIAAAAA
ncbi:MAG: chromosome segregation protein ScpA [Verrucomicrobia bacterium]|nr:MAG: chromosome segregation protein ScpA [Verrucomicrobiota bacterium]